MSQALDIYDFYDIRSELDEVEQQVHDSVARFVDEKVLPIIADAYDEHRFPSELVPQLAEMGLLGCNIDGYECAGLNNVAYGLICQELERGDSGLRSFVSVQGALVMYPIWRYGTDEQKDRWLPALHAGSPLSRS